VSARSFAQFLESKRREYGARFDASDLASAFVPYYESGARIEVQDGPDKVRGRVGVTTGWRPCFLLMRRRSDRGSSYTISERNKVLRVVSS
jgi:hypothetical protein